MPAMQAPTASPQDPTPGYDRDAIIASITSYYELLSKTVPLSKLLRLGFNDWMIDFIRHVPSVVNSIRPVFPYTDSLVYYTSVFDTYPDDAYQVEDPHRAFMWPIPGERMSEGVLPLSRPIETAQLGTWWMLDTNNGDLTPHAPSTTCPAQEIPQHEQWRTPRPLPTTTYFASLCADLTSLTLLPMPGGVNPPYWEIWDAPHRRGPHDDNFLSWTNEAKAIYRQCKWPDGRAFQRARCRRLLVAFLAEFDLFEREGVGMPLSVAAAAAAGVDVDVDVNVGTSSLATQEQDNDRTTTAPWTENATLQTTQEGIFVATTFQM